MGHNHLFGKGADKVLGDALELLEVLLGQLTGGGDVLEEVGLVSMQVRNELSLELLDLLDRDVIDVTVDTSVDEGDHLLGRHGGSLLLLEEESKSLTSGKSLLGGSIKIGTELGKGSNFSVLGQEELEGTGNLLHGLDLGSGTDSRDGKTDVNGGSDTLVEELGLEENLTIGNRNNVGRNVGGHITTLGLNDGQGSKGSSTLSLVHLGGSLKKSGMEVENITGVSLSSGRSSQKQRHLSVGNGLLGKIVEDNQGTLAVVSEPLTHGGTSEGSKVLERGSLGGGSSNNDRVLEGIVVLKSLDKLGDGRSLLANGNVDTVELLLLVLAVVPSLLVKNGIDGNLGLTGLSVTDNQLSLASANGDKGIDGLKTGLHGLVDGGSGENTGGLNLGSDSELSLDGSLTIDGVTEGIDDSTEKGGSDGDVDNGTGSLDGLTLLDESIRTEQHNTDLAGLQVKGHTLDTGSELDELLSLDVVEAENSGDTITGLVLSLHRVCVVIVCCVVLNGVLLSTGYATCLLPTGQ